MAIASPVDAIRITATLTRLLRFVDQELRCAVDEQLGVTELGVLGSVERGVELPSAVARSLRLDPGRVTRVVDLLVRRGYVDRGVDIQDRRRCPLTLTVEGHAQLDEGRSVVTRAMETVIGRLPTPDQENLVSGLDSLRAVLDELPSP
jgi:MarR family transcriptional regulator, organic hydroperoxide resistance regulator